MREVWIPLSVRTRMHEAMKAATPPEGVDIRWAELEEALTAMQPFLNLLLDAPETILTKPTNNGDSLEDNHA